MDKRTAYDAIISYFETETDEFNTVIEEIDSYSGFLGDDAYYDMEMLDDFYYGVKAEEILRRAFYGHDEETWVIDDNGEKEYGAFNPNRNFFKYNGYGNLVSADYKDYSIRLDDYFVEELIKTEPYIYSLPSEVKEIIENIEE